MERVFQGDIRKNKDYILCKRTENKKIRIKELFEFTGLGKSPLDIISSGDIYAIIGIDDFEIGDTITSIDEPKSLPRIKIDEPTMSMLFTINNSPFFGKRRKICYVKTFTRNRLMKETEKNLALKVEETESEDKFNVYGRGILHLSILIETMRREGYELQVENLE